MCECFLVDDRDAARFQRLSDIRPHSSMPVCWMPTLSAFNEAISGNREMSAAALALDDVVVGFHMRFPLLMVRFFALMAFT